MAGHPTPKTQKNQKTHKTTPKQKKNIKENECNCVTIKKIAFDHSPISANLGKFSSC